MTDEGLHEVQLNGKQLVFLFMVGTVFMVVVFLSGVMVGRGLRAPAGLNLATASAAAIDPTASVQADPAASPTASSSAGLSTGGVPVSAGESLTYTGRLESPTPPAETLGGEAETPSRDAVRAPLPSPEPVAAAPAAATKAVAPPPAAPAPPPGLTEPAGDGFVVQVMAVNTRAEADAIARRLASKGYPTFVTTTGAGAKVSYRVRVGKYGDKREADAVSARLQKEEQFNPWVTR
jgi:cell division protein FtsN